MPTVNYVLPDGARYSVDAKVGDSVMATAIRNDINGIVAECGGALACATCHVYVDEGDLAQLAPIDEFQDELLDGTASERTEESRLSCQIILEDSIESITVTVPHTQV